MISTMRLFVLIAGLCAAAISCSSDTPAAPDTPFDVNLVLAIGETQPVAGSALRVRFDAVLGDSRCPGDALCILGGDAIVQITVLPDGSKTVTFELHTGDMQPAHYNNVTIALVQLSPYPFVSNPIDPRSYRAKLRLTR
jgi:hypothetical protein